VLHTTSYHSLKDKVIFITGGATGIGAAMVKAFIEQGALVSFIDTNEQAAKQLIKELNLTDKPQLMFHQGNVTDVEELQQIIALTAKQHDGIDVLINNVADDIRHKPEDILKTDWHQCMQVNLDSAFFASQAVLPYMKRHLKGAIINLSSINALLGPKNMVGYTTAKAGLLGMTKALATDFGQFNIRVNAILPGWVATDKQLASYLTEQEEQKWTEEMAIKQRLNPQDVALLALFLASDDSQMITGQGINIDGGRT